MEPFAEVVETLGGESVVVVLPREAGLDETARGERLACGVLVASSAGRIAGILTGLDDEEVLGVDVAVLGEVEVLLRNEYALCGDRVSAYPCMQHKATNCTCGAIAMARSGEILTAEEVPADTMLAKDQSVCCNR